ncbi:replication endonuclease [Diaphorobacter sp. HDW4A]|uniref:replication endonuclease n=1 Tax=Diaphorobacter sp. HDW4A TaxID=2714924 RepID=UPI001407521E|nr:replication endonuclease [Diaphorobacter sp. HDW4A]QIL78487.1 replication endonuclease [Diaphorobacter sp. HDW4A]
MQMNAETKTREPAGEIGLFVTLTLPAKFYPNQRGVGGKLIDNPFFDGSSPLSGHEWLRVLWGKVRAALARNGVRMHGLRYVVPNFDGVPQWSLIAWVRSDEDARVLESVTRHYWLASAGADGSRIGANVERLEPGCASRYMNAYADDVLGDQAVIAWAATWGVRLTGRFGFSRTGEVLS